MRTLYITEQGEPNISRHCCALQGREHVVWITLFITCDRDGTCACTFRRGSASLEPPNEACAHACIIIRSGGGEVRRNGMEWKITGLIKISRKSNALRPITNGMLSCGGGGDGGGGGSEGALFKRSNIARSPSTTGRTFQNVFSSTSTSFKTLDKASSEVGWG